ncbi:MAG: universal stress protein [Gammaproteobacteria bacterium]
MYARIVVPLDGSELSEQVLPYVIHLAETFKSTVELLHAVQTEDIPENVVAEVRQESISHLERIAGTIPKQLKPTYTVESGHAAELIINAADAREGSLIVMATHGYSGLQRWFLGSTAHKVVQAATSPVLLVPAGIEEGPDGKLTEFDKVIVPLDGSPLAERILPYATDLCKALNMELIVVRAYNPRFPGTSIRMHEISQIVHDSAENYVAEKVRQLKNEGVKKVSYKVLHGVPARQITDFALATPRSLTAMCTHGRHGVGRWVLGSVTDAVIHSLEEPVLVIRMPH